MIITPGTFVRLKHDPSRAGVLENGEKYTAGAQMVEVRFADGQVKWLLYSALEPVPSASENLWDRFTAGATQTPRGRLTRGHDDRIRSELLQPGTNSAAVGSSSRTGCAARSPGRE